MSEDMFLDTDLERAITRAVAQRTGGRIRGLAVTVSKGRVQLNGRVAWFHLKQLALQGILDVIGSVAAMRIDLDIEVHPEEPARLEAAHP